MKTRTFVLAGLVLAALGLASVEAGIKPLTQQSAKDAIQKGQAAKKSKDLCAFFQEVRPKLADRAREFSVFIRTPLCDV